MGLGAKIWEIIAERSWVRDIEQNWWAAANFEILTPKMRSAASKTVHGQWYLEIYDKYGYAEAKGLLELLKNGCDIRKIQNPSELVKLAAIKRDPNQIQYIESPSDHLVLEVIRSIGKLAAKSDLHISYTEVERTVYPLTLIKNVSESVQIHALSALGNLESCTTKRNRIQAAREYVLLWNGEPSEAVLNANEQCKGRRNMLHDYKPDDLDVWVQKPYCWDEKSYAPYSSGPEHTFPSERTWTAAERRRDQARIASEDLPGHGPGNR